MGLDVALGIVILFAALRGWIKGFVSQAVRLIGFVACFYLADPVREEARPYVLAKLPKIDPALMDRILWWVSAVVSYVVLVGLITLTIQVMRTPSPPGLSRSKRNDQFAGLLLGVLKGGWSRRSWPPVCKNTCRRSSRTCPGPGLSRTTRWR